MEKIMVILTQEPEYSRELASYLASSEEFPYKPVVFTDEAVFARFAQENQISLLLCDREDIVRESGFDEGNVCYLSEYSSVREGDDKKNTVFKYQSTEQIKNEIMRRFDPSGRAMIGRTVIPRRERGARIPGVLNGEDLYIAGAELSPAQCESEVHETRTVCVCSPIGGGRCSTYAFALAEHYAKKEETLFLSLDPFFEVLKDDAGGTVGSLTEFLYCLETSSADRRMLLSEYVKRNGRADCLPRIANWLDVYDITAEQAHELMSCVLSEDMYRNIVIDLGRPTSAFLECMALCTDIYVPRRKGKHDDAAIGEWKQQLVFAGYGDIAGRLKERTLPFDKGLEGELSMDRLLSGPLGGYIRETEDFGYFG